MVNDGDEGGVSFSQDEYEVQAEESAPPGAALARLEAHAAGGGRLLYGLHAARAPASLPLFRLHELSGALELAQPLDRYPPRPHWCICAHSNRIFNCLVTLNRFRESAGVHELTVWARDSAPRASRAFARVTVRVRSAEAHVPTWGRRLAEARLARGAAQGTLIAALRAGSADAGEAARIVYSLAGGDAGGQFAVDAALGDVRLARELPARGAREYTLHVRAAGPPPATRGATLPLHVVIVEPDNAPPRYILHYLTI